MNTIFSIIFITEKLVAIPENVAAITMNNKNVKKNNVNLHLFLPISKTKRCKKSVSRTILTNMNLPWNHADHLVIFLRFACKVEQPEMYSYERIVKRKLSYK